MEISDSQRKLIDLFGPLMSLLNLFRYGESEKIPSTQVLLNQSGITEIKLNIQSFPPQESDIYLTKALERLKETTQLGDSIFKNLRYEYIENAFQDEETGYPEDYDNIRDSKAYALGFFKKIEYELLKLKADVQREIASNDKVHSKRKEQEKKPLSFKYKYLDQRPADINTLYNKLVKADLVSEDSPFLDFKKIFSGDEVQNPVVWTGSQSDLFHLIKQIHTVNKSVDSRTNEIWKITTHCFLNHEGKRYSINWRSQKSPSNSDRQAMINNIAAHLKS
jgi:hypothetical protein